VFGEQYFLPAKYIDRLSKAIADAEKDSSGEIRLYFEKKCEQDVLERAVQIFQELEMHKTVLRNGVLIYVAYQSHHFAIIGDEAIHAVVHQQFWDEMHNIVLQHFKQNRHVEGLEQIIVRIGNQLRNYFPYREDDVNELPDDIIIK
jgi:uncharacterized membrane protein